MKLNEVHINNDKNLAIIHLNDGKSIRFLKINQGSLDSGFEGLCSKCYLSNIYRFDGSQSCRLIDTGVYLCELACYSTAYFSIYMNLLLCSYRRIRNGNK